MVFGKWRHADAREGNTVEGKGMTGGVWMSDLKGNQQLGDDQGIQTKFYGHDWEPATSIVPPTPDEVLRNMRLYSQGYARARDELPEAAAVWDEKRFKKAGDIFSVGFFVVRGKLAHVFSRYDLGEGGLIPFPVYQADLETLYPGEFFLLNFGATKNTILPEQCGNAKKFFVDKDSGLQVWKINQIKPDADVVGTPAALTGPDLWFEEAVHNKIFMSDALAQEISAIGMADVFRLHECRVVG